MALKLPSHILEGTFSHNTWFGCHFISANTDIGNSVGLQVSIKALTAE
jgi:hypothetical protein